jgi:hypothetical protein
MFLCRKVKESQYETILSEDGSPSLRMLNARRFSERVRIYDCHARFAAGTSSRAAEYGTIA